MTTVNALYLDGSSIQLTKCKNVGQIMIHVANVHRRFAQDVAVMCPDTGRDLTESPSQVPPPAVQIAVKTEDKAFSDEDLLLALCLHGQFEDAAMCVRAYEMLKKRHDEDALDHVLFRGVFGKPLSGTTDVEIQRTIVQTLLRMGVNLNYFLYNAAEHQDESMVKMLLSAGVPIEGDAVKYSETEESCWYTRAPPLSIAAKRGYLSVVEILLAHKADANRIAKLPYGEFVEFGTPLLFASDMKHFDVAQTLLTHKALVDFPVPCDSAKKTPLYMALRSGSEEVVELLLTNRANPLDTDGCSLLNEACKSGSAKMLQMLVDYGSSVRGDHIGSFIMASSSVAVVETLLDLYMSDVLNFPLLEACHHGKLELPNVLLDHKADVNGTTKPGPTPLSTACYYGQLDMARTLLARKANVNADDGHGKTALAEALDANNKALADLLQQHGAALLGESRNEVSAGKRARESEDCSSPAARKRQKPALDETSGEKTCLSGNDLAKEEEKQNHLSTSEENNNKQFTSDERGSRASTIKD